VVAHSAGAFEITTAAVDEEQELSEVSIDVTIGLLDP
jgi:hypothetical protein